MTQHETTYVCPRTRRSLVRHGADLVGPAGERYRVRDGVPDFLAYPPAKDPELDRLRRANERSREVGWLQALQETTGDMNVRYVTSPCRTAYVDLLPLQPTSAVLEVGCSLGQGTAALARRAASVHAVDVVHEQAVFALERVRQEGLGNVTVCTAGDDCRLPFPEARFDLAVLNLVFEWCGQRERGSFVEAQRRLLAEVARTLRPGGVLYLATKNRFGLHYLTGSPDEHAHELPFGNALPRPLLRLLQRARASDGAAASGPHGLLHSHRSLRRMLADAGFGGVRSFWAAPDARFPRAYVPADAASVREARATLPPDAQGACRRVRALVPWVPAGLLVHVAPHIVLTAVRGGTLPQRSRDRRAA